MGNHYGVASVSMPANGGNANSAVTTTFVALETVLFARKQEASTSTKHNYESKDTLILQTAQEIIFQSVVPNKTTKIYFTLQKK